MQLSLLPWCALCIFATSSSANFNDGTAATPVDLDVLVLVPWPDTREEASWDVGLELIPGARIAAEEVNNRNDVLLGYRINIIEAGHEACGLLANSLGLTNLVYNGLNSASRDSSTAAAAIAVAGLYCSPSTQAIAPLVNLNDAQLIQLSASNSPTFNKNYKQFPHLWRFLQSSEVYADMMLHLMNKYDWSQIAIISSQDNAFLEGIVASLNDRLQKSNLEPVYQGQVVKLIDEFEEQVLDGLVTSKSRILFISAPSNEVASLLCKAFGKGIIYPQYLWVVADWELNTLINTDECSEAVLRQVLEGCILSNFSLTPHDESLLLSGYNYDTYIEKYTSELESVKQEYEDLINQTDTMVGMSLGYSGVLYDQIWALSLALNDSLSELATRNLPLADYGFGQPLVTEIIERNLEKLSFQGASSYIDFTNQQEVRTPINIYQVRNGSDILVGDRVVFDSNYSTVSDIDLIFSADLDDEIPSFYQTVPIPVTVTLAVLEVLLFIFITVVLFLFIKHRNAKHIKAKSVKISLMMFIAFYASIISCTLDIFITSVQLDKLPFSILCNFEFFITYNSAMLLYGTLLLKIERIHKIFHNKKLEIYSSWKYSNWAIVLRVIALIAIGNIILVTALVVGGSPLQQKFVEILTPYKPSISATFKYPVCGMESISKYGVHVFFLYMGFIMCFILYYASQSRKIQLSEFKDTKLINLFLLLTFIALVACIPFNEVFFVGNQYIIYLKAVHFCFLAFLIFCALVMLFLPSILITTVGSNKYFSTYITK